jgi:hypothetical protein
MPAFVNTPGPIDHYINFRTPDGGLEGWAYLGTAVSAPETDGDLHYLDVFNDLGGRSVPFQLVEDGQNDVVASTMNRFDPIIYSSLRDISGFGDGVDTALTRGQLAIGALDFQLLLINAFNIVNPALIAAGAPAGRLYYSSVLAKYKESTVGTRVKEVALAFRCENIYNNSTYSTTRTFGLYTEDPTIILSLGVTPN